MAAPKNSFHGRAAGYRSGLEESVSGQIQKATGAVSYEQLKIKYAVPSRSAQYTPDFELPNGIIIETKGRFTLDDRKKHLLIKEQHPEKDIRFVFSRSKTPISKGSPTTYAHWCEKNGFKYADKWIPEEWLNEIKGQKDYE